MQAAVTVYLVTGVYEILTEAMAAFLYHCYSKQNDITENIREKKCFTIVVSRVDNVPVMTSINQDAHVRVRVNTPVQLVAPLVSNYDTVLNYTEVRFFCCIQLLDSDF